MKKEKENPSYYAIIPANIRYDDKLSTLAKLLYGEITCLSNKTGECWATNNYFAKLYKKSNRQISRCINELREQDYINVVILGDDDFGSKRFIKIVGYRQKCDEGIDKNVVSSQDKNVQHNNTSNNNTSIITTTAEKNELVSGTNELTTDEVFGIRKKKKNNGTWAIGKELLNKWNTFADKHNLEKVLDLSVIRLKNIKERTSEQYFDFNEILHKIEQSDFWLHEFRNNKGMFFDYLIKNKDNYLKILEQTQNKKKKTNVDILKQLMEQKNKLMKGIKNENDKEAIN